MSRKYKRRRNSSQTSVYEDVVGIGSLLVLLSTISVSKNIIDNVKHALPLMIFVLSLLVGLIVFIMLKRRARIRAIYEAYSLANIDTMTGIEFEIYLADLLRRRGFNDVSLTEHYDFGVDIIARKDGVTWGIQAKRYNNIVKAEAVRQVFTALVRYKCDKAMVITNSTFSRPARELANDNRIKLIDRSILEKWIYESSKATTD